MRFQSKIDMNSYLSRKTKSSSSFFSHAKKKRMTRTLIPFFFTQFPILFFLHIQLILIQSLFRFFRIYAFCQKWFALLSISISSCFFLLHVSYSSGKDHHSNWIYIWRMFVRLNRMKFDILFSKKSIRTWIIVVNVW
jgi:hypothetical protein